MDFLYRLMKEESPRVAIMQDEWVVDRNTGEVGIYNMIDDCLEDLSTIENKEYWITKLKFAVQEGDLEESVYNEVLRKYKD